jgi:CubicO group peptidase (beta-lactamase class C family)
VTVDAAGRLDAALAGAGFRGAVCVERRGSTLLDAAYRSDGDGTALRPGTAFQIASVSKPITATAVLLLVDRGILSLDDPVGSWIAGAPGTWDGVTIRRLLTHTSGLPHWSELSDVDLHRAWPWEELLARFAAAPPLFEPGCGWAYSGPGYVLVAHVVEAAAGEPYGAFVEGSVLRPLGLGATGVAEPPVGAGRARGSRDGSPVASIHLPSVGLGTGDLWSTTADLVHFPRALRTSGLLGSASLAESVAPLARIPDAEEGLDDLHYGLGWFTASIDGHRIVFHPGDQPGFRALLVRAAEVDLTVAMLSADETSFSALALTALRDLLAETG